MTRRVRVALQILFFLLFIGLLIPFLFFVRDSPVRRENKLINDAKTAFYRREFLQAYKTYEHLIDSLHFEEEAAYLNYGNAALMSSSILKNGLYGSPQKKPDVADTVLQQIGQRSQDIFQVLTTSREKKIASMAHNQLGYSGIKAGFSQKASDSVLMQSLYHFREALKANPNNDSARYNFELIKKILGFPETTMAQTRTLIAQHRYVEASQFLEEGMRRDIRLRSQQEFLKRLKSVAGIDTTYSARK